MVYLTQNKKPISGPVIKYATIGMVIQPVKVDGSWSWLCSGIARAFFYLLNLSIILHSRQVCKTPQYSIVKDSIVPGLIPENKFCILVLREKREAIMEHRVDRVFTVLLVMFSVVFGIFSVFYRSDEILGFSGDYWAGISCISIILLILGWAVVIGLRGTRN